MKGDLYKVVCATPKNYGRWQIGLACGCSLLVLQGDMEKEKLPCVNEHPAEPPATPPPGGWPKAEPPPEPPFDPPTGWNKDYD